MTEIKQKKEKVKEHLKDLRQNLKKMHLEVTEDLILPEPNDVKKLINKMDQLLKLIGSNWTILLTTRNYKKQKWKE